MLIRSTYSLLMLLIFSSCLPSSNDNSSSSSNSDSTDSGSDTTVTVAGGGSSPINSPALPGTTGSSCTGSVADGYDPGGDEQPLVIFPLVLAGGQEWDYLRDSQSSSQSARNTLQPLSTLIQLYNNSNDGRLQVRFKVNEEPEARNLDACYGRTEGGIQQHKYSKLKFKVQLQAVYCNARFCPDTSVTCRCPGNYIADPNGYSVVHQVSPVEVGQCSNIIELKNDMTLLNSTLIKYINGQKSVFAGGIVRVYDVRYDVDCQGGAARTCPAETAVRSTSCFDMTMQLSTDAHYPFK